MPSIMEEDMIFIFYDVSYINILEKFGWSKSSKCLLFTRCAKMKETRGKLSHQITSSQKIRSIYNLYIIYAYTIGHYRLI